MTANALWHQHLDGEHRRHRQVARVLRLAPAAPKPVAPVVPADYLQLHDAVKPQPKFAGLLALGAVAVFLHAAVLFAIVNLKTSEPVTPPELPQIEVVLTPPKPIEPPPPVAQPEPPKPVPKPVVKKVIPKPIPKPVQQPIPQDVVKVAPPPPVEAPPQPVVETVTEPSADAEYLNNETPPYPALAARQGWEGTVWVNVFVKSNGLPGQVELQKSSGRKTLDDAAVNAIKKWRFIPAKRGKTPIDAWFTIPYEFSLDN